MTLDEYFATGPDREQPIYEAVMAVLDGVGPVHVEPVAVGIFLKKAGSFAQLRPLDRWVALSLSLGRVVTHPTITRKVQLWGGRWYHVFNLRGPEDVDADIGGWLVEAYLEAPG